jgi:SulP family sulfate permease
VKALIPVGIVAGALMVLAGLLRLGRWIERVPWSVMEGFTLGIALTIAFQQIPLAFATTKAEGENALIVAVRTIGDVAWSSATWGSLALVVLTLAVKFRWRAYAEKRHMRFHVPGSIIAISVVTLVSLGLDVARVGSLPAGNLFHFELSTAGLGLGAIFYAALSVALLGGIESLLSARMADAMVHRRDGVLTERHRPNRELLGQGLGTMAASMLGGMPATGAIARTSVNVHAGARTKWASAFHAFLILAFVLVLGPVISVIPTAGLAGVLLGTSWRIASPATIAESLRTTRGEQVTFLVTALSVVAIDLIWGIVIGVVAHLISGRLSQGASRAR